MITVYTKCCTGSVLPTLGTYYTVYITRLLRLRREYQFYLREMVTTFVIIFECSLTGLCIRWLQIAIKHKRWIYSCAHFSLLPPRLFYAMFFLKFLWKVKLTLYLHLWWLLPNLADPTGKGKFGTMNLYQNRNTFFCSSSGDGETKRGRIQIKPFLTYRLSAFPLISLCTKNFQLRTGSEHQKSRLPADHWTPMNRTLNIRHSVQKAHHLMGALKSTQCNTNTCA